MFKVLIWDYTGISAQWTDNFLRKDVEIIRTLHPDDTDQAEVVLRGEWNFVLIFEQGTRKIFDDMLNTMRAMNFSTENIIFAEEIQSWLDNPAAVYALLKSEAQETFLCRFGFCYNRDHHHYIAATAEGLHYVGTSADEYISFSTYAFGQNYSENDMKRFHALAQKFYGVDDGAGYFLDLGANIGTTGIYFTRKLAPDLKLLAFEPDAENFKLLRVNLLLNDLGDDKAIAVNSGLGDKFDEMTMYRNLENPGGNSTIQYESDMPHETIKIMPLDSYLAENNIAAQDVKYIWIDTEGFEAQVLLGAKNLLTENPAPIFVEFNLGAWRKSGCFDEFFAVIAGKYSHFILLDYGKETLYPIDALRTLTPPTEGFGRIGGDIFLIKAGTSIS